MPLILGTNSIKDTGYDVDNSCRFDDGSSPYLTESVSSTSNRRTFTFSTWVKRSSLSGSGYPRLFNPFTDSGNFFDIFFRDTDALHIYSEQSSSSDMSLVTTRLFRDVSAFYNIVVAVDTTQGTAANRVKVYINGTQETSFSTSTYPAEDLDLQINLDGVDNVIGRNEAGDDNYLDGYLSEVVLIDGLQLAPTSFGEFDEDSPTIWKPIDVSGLTFGTNGFYLPFSNKGKIHTLSASGDVHHETDQKKFGDTSIYFDGTGDALSVNDIGQLTFTGDFTFECWIRCGDQADNYATFFDDDPGGHRLRVTLGSSSSSTPKLSAYSGVWDEHVTGTTDIGDDAWHHCAVVRDNGTIRIFVDGTSENTRADSGGLVDLDRTHLGQYSFVSAGGQLPFTGYLDEIRISSIARYTSNFTPSTSVFSDDEHTRLLIHSDTTDGSTTFTDSSGVAGGIGNDDSGNNNDFTSSNIDTNVDQATDTPTNSFCTFNSIATTNSVGNTLTFAEGNCKITNTSDGGWTPAIGNMGATNGKWYAEFKVSTIGGASKYGIIDVTQYLDNVNFASTGRAYSYEYNSGDAYNAGNYDADYGDSFTTDDIISVAMDLDNMKLYFAKNGAWQDSGDPTSGATGTGTHAYFGGGSNSANAAGVDTYAFAANIHNSSVTEANFGNPSYANSSSNADGNGYGDFEYAVPSGYYALCTKNLAEYG